MAPFSDPDVMEVITVCLGCLFLYLFAIMYSITCRLMRVRSASGLAWLPRDVGMYQRLPQAGAFGRDSLPAAYAVGTAVTPESDTWLVYRVHRGHAVVQLPSKKPEEDPSEHILDEFNYGLLLPAQTHFLVHMSPDCLIHMELCTKPDAQPQQDS
jgi:hypothetical protein